MLTSFFRFYAAALERRKGMQPRADTHYREREKKWRNNQEKDTPQNQRDAANKPPSLNQACDTLSQHTMGPTATPINTQASSTIPRFLLVLPKNTPNQRQTSLFYKPIYLNRPSTPPVQELEKKKRKKHTNAFTQNTDPPTSKYSETNSQEKKKKKSNHTQSSQNQLLPCDESYRLACARFASQTVPKSPSSRLCPRSI